MYVKEGDNVTIYCTALGYPLPSVSWLKHGKPTHSSNSFPKRGKGAKIEYASIRYENEGLYTCVASSSIGLMTFDIRVIFKGKL